MAEKELDYLLNQYNKLLSEIDDIESTIENLCEELPEVQKLHR